MKQVVLSVCLLFLGISIYADTEYTIITDDLTYVKHMKLTDGSYYTGWVNANNLPCGIGKLTKTEASDEIYACGQYSNGKINGFFWQENLYEGMMMEGIANGFGRKSNTITCLWENGEFKTGLCFKKGEKAVIKIENQTIEASYYYERKLYDENKENIKNILSLEGVRFIEDEPYSYGDYVYSGGWKNGQPYLYGAIKKIQDPTIHHVICGHILCMNGERIEWDFAKEIWVERINCSNGDPDHAAYEKYSVDKNGDSTHILIEPFQYEFETHNQQGQITMAERYKLTCNQGEAPYNRINKIGSYYHQLNSNEDSISWAISYNDDQGLSEGVLDDDKTYHYRSIAWGGEYAENSVTMFANGCKILSLNDNYAILIFPSGDYSIGEMRSTYNQTNFPKYPSSVLPYCVNEYFSDGEIYKKLCDDNKINAKIEFYSSIVQSLLDQNLPMTSWRTILEKANKVDLIEYEKLIKGNNELVEEIEELVNRFHPTNWKEFLFDLPAAKANCEQRQSYYEPMLDSLENQIEEALDNLPIDIKNRYQQIKQNRKTFVSPSEKEQSAQQIYRLIDQYQQSIESNNQYVVQYLQKRLSMFHNNWQQFTNDYTGNNCYRRYISEFKLELDKLEEQIEKSLDILPSNKVEYYQNLKLQRKYFGPPSNDSKKKKK